ncbi:MULTISPECIES: hypothetical protein [Nonomuraea]|uniref:hypothetical protein n=1 Tax=Nonomuraea TaxID=83681 RepID=UPI0036D395B8
MGRSEGGEEGSGVLDERLVLLQRPKFPARSSSVTASPGASRSANLLIVMSVRMPAPPAAGASR